MILFYLFIFKGISLFVWKIILESCMCLLHFKKNLFSLEKSLNSQDDDDEYKDDFSYTFLSMQRKDPLIFLLHGIDRLGIKN